MSQPCATANRRGRCPFNGLGITTPTLRSTTVSPAVAELGRLGGELAEHNHNTKSTNNDMKTSPTRLLLVGSAFLAVTLLSGCALTKDYVSLSYVPQTNVAKIDGADAVTVRVDVTDVRTVKDPPFLPGV